MQKAEVKGQAAEILNKMARKPFHNFLHTVKNCCDNGKLDHNQLRKAIIAGFRCGDKKAVLLGSLLLQLEPQEVHELIKDQPLFN